METITALKTDRAHQGQQVKRRRHQHRRGLGTESVIAGILAKLVKGIQHRQHKREGRGD